MPSWRYDDYSCCDNILGYGPSGESFVQLARRKYLSKNFKALRYIQSSCENVRSIKKSFEKHNYQEGLKFKNSKVLYVTTRIRGLEIINSKSIFSPVKNIQFVRKFLQYNKNVDVKVHPKGQEVDSGVPPKRIVSGNLVQILPNYEIVVMDNLLSTAFAIVAASKLPIIFFGPSLDGFSKEGNKFIKERVYFYQTQINSCQVPDGFSAETLFFPNNSSEFSDHFSLSNKFDNYRSRLEILMRAI